MVTNTNVSQATMLDEAAISCFTGLLEIVASGGRRSDAATVLRLYTGLLKTFASPRIIHLLEARCV